MDKAQTWTKATSGSPRGVNSDALVDFAFVPVPDADKNFEVSASASDYGFLRTYQQIWEIRRSSDRSLLIRRLSSVRIGAKKSFRDEVRKVLWVALSFVKNSRFVCRFSNFLFLIVTSIVLGMAFDLRCFTIYTNVKPEIKKYNYCCAEQSLQITQRGQQMTSASSISNLNAIEGLEFFSMTVNFVPRFDETLAKNLKSLRITLCNLKEIKQEDLAQFPLMESLSLWINDLTTLPGNLFDRNTKIKFIAMQSNKYTSIGAEILKPLTSLEWADFSDAGCVDFHATDEAKMQILKEKLKACTVLVNILFQIVLPLR
jgi:hypothetical protein